MRCNEEEPTSDHDDDIIFVFVKIHQLPAAFFFLQTRLVVSMSVEKGDQHISRLVVFSARFAREDGSFRANSIASIHSLGASVGAITRPLELRFFLIYAEKKGRRITIGRARGKASERIKVEKKPPPTTRRGRQ